MQTELTLNDFRAIALSMLLLLGSIVVFGGLWEFRAEVGLLLRQRWQRYVEFRWHGVTRDYVTSEDDVDEGSLNTVPPQGNAMEPDWEPPVGNAFPTEQAVIAFLGTCSDAALLDILAQVKQGDSWAFAESRIGKFIPGRVEDNIASVRQARGAAAPDAPDAPPARIIRVNGGDHELIVDW
jgi:hypothetical protein